ncbi:MAG: hypothetical protein ACREJC_00150 [Tepidisphaeraceae bacterium]
MILLNPTVGVAPGTTTMQLGGACPPDPVHLSPFTMTMPEIVAPAMAPITSAAADASNGAGYWVILPDNEKLRGLSDAGAPRWGLVLFAGLTAFVGVFGYRYWRRRH